MTHSLSRTHIHTRTRAREHIFGYKDHERDSVDLCVSLKNKWIHKGCNRDDTSQYIFQGLAFFDTFGTTPNYFADRTVTLRRFGTGFLVLFIGMFLSACLLVAEIFYAKRRGTAVSGTAAGGRVAA